MDITEQLSDLRRDFPECEAMAFADISTGLVLCVSSRQKKSQEWLDRVCRSAMEALDGAFARKASRAMSGSEDGLVREAIHLANGTLHLYLRSPAVPTEALCCVCTPGVAVDALITHARLLLHEISTAEATFK